MESFVESGQKIILNSLQKILKEENVESGEVLNALNLMLQDGDDGLQKKRMAYCVWNLIDQKQVIFQSKDIPKLVELFKKCVKSDFSNKFVSKTIESLISNNWQGEYQKVWFEELINILSDCSKNNSSKNYVAKAVDMLISKCCVAQKLILKIISILDNCLYDSRENGEFIASSIKNLTTLGLLNIVCAVKNLAQNDPFALKQVANEMNNFDKEFIGQRKQRAGFERDQCFK